MTEVSAGREGRRVEVSAPGKTILMGEHAAVYGHPALVAAIDQRMRAVVEASSAQGVRLDLPQVDVQQQCSWQELIDYGRRAAAAWELYRETPSPEAFGRVRGDDPAHLVKVAVGEVVDFLGRDAVPGGGQGLHLAVHSEIPLGAGFGSSAAASAAIVSALLTWFGVTPSYDDLHALTLNVERRQHGFPSGIDTSTVIHGGLVWAERQADGSLHSEPLSASPPWLRRVRIFNSGRPRQSTGDVVAAVRRLRQTDRRRFDGAMETIVAATETLRRTVLDGSPGEGKMVALMRRCQRGLEALGVVPEEIMALVRRVEAAGGGAKISGAGALRGPAAGSLLVFHEEDEIIDTWRFLDPLQPVRTTLGAAGVRQGA